MTEIRIVEKGKITRRIKCEAFVLGCYVPEEDDPDCCSWTVSGPSNEVAKLGLCMGWGVLKLLDKERGKLAEVKG